MNKKIEVPIGYKKDKIIRASQLGGEETLSEVSRSEYSMQDVIDVEQFKALSKEMKLDNKQHDRLVDSFYRHQWKPNSTKFERQTDVPSAYYEQYNKWKGDTFVKDDPFKSTYASTLALLNKQQQKIEVDRLLKDYSINQAVFSYSSQNPLSNINKQYVSSLAKVTSKTYEPSNMARANIQSQAPFIDKSLKSNPVANWKDQLEKQRNQQKLSVIQLQVQQQLLHNLKKINEKQKKQQEKARKEKQLKRSCFVDLIERPPSIREKANQINDSKNINQNDLEEGGNIFSQTRCQKEICQTEGEQKVKNRTKATYRLNVDEIVKIPHRLFLIFYSDNYHQIVRLSTPDELKRINNYREQALKRQQAVQKLKKKVAEQGSQMISKLPSQLKEKLFKILYEQDLQEEKYAQGHHEVMIRQR